MEYEATELKPGRYAVRPKGQLGTCGWYPAPWTVIYVTARTANEAIRKAAGGCKMIIFENSGEIDVRLAMIMGVNIKETDTPVGLFGTGLKYAIACLTRWEEEITIQSGLAEFSFSSEPVSIRGKDFSLINLFSKLDHAQLGFTTELGKHWQPWMVYRELWSNAKDEPNSRVYETSSKPAPSANVTRVIVAGAQIDAAHNSRREFILSSEPSSALATTPELEIYPGPSRGIFYRGILVQSLDKPSIFTYNIKAQLYLTEDRTAGSWSTDPIIVRDLAKLDNKHIIESCLLASSGNMESRLDYDYLYLEPGSLWQERAKYYAENKPLDVHASIRKRFSSDKPQLCPTCGKPI